MKTESTLEGIDTETIDREVEFLSRFMGSERFDTLCQTTKLRTNYMTVCVENIFHPQNASAIIRSCEAFGLQNVHVVENLTHFRPNVNIVKGSDKWVDINHYPKNTSTTDIINTLRSKGYKIVAATPHEVDYTPQTLDISEPIALFFGTEKQGISKELEQNADSFIKIPMYGFVESLNVSVCAAIMIQTIMDRVRSSDIAWQLSERKQKELLHRWMRYSVRDAERILQKFRDGEIL
ncbi:MAG: RNA methyltransferase [Rikenellaceae bacterium]